MMLQCQKLNKQYLIYQETNSQDMLMVEDAGLFIDSLGGFREFTHHMFTKL